MINLPPSASLRLYAAKSAGQHAKKRGRKGNGRLAGEVVCSCEFDLWVSGTACTMP